MKSRERNPWLTIITEKQLHLKKLPGVFFQPHAHFFSGFRLFKGEPAGKSKYVQSLTSCHDRIGMCDKKDPRHSQYLENRPPAQEAGTNL